jgi:hypothetical protein
LLPVVAAGERAILVEVVVTLPVVAVAALEDF